MKKVVFFVLLALVLAAGVAYYNFAHHTGGSGNLPLNGTPQPWQPARLQIPRMHVNAPVISVGKTASGMMDAPTSKAYNSPYWTSVFWYATGPAPGQEGNAVIAGHVDRAGGDPAIFWTLDSLTPGDQVSVVTIQGSILHFQVDKVVSYPVNTPGQQAVNAVFGPTSGHHLNLITCSGVWTGNGYDRRLVVFTTQVA